MPTCSYATQAYQRAIRRVVKQRQQQDGEAHVLDIGCGTGILSLLAAKAGQWVPPVCAVNRPAASQRVLCRAAPIRPAPHIFLSV